MGEGEGHIAAHVNTYNSAVLDGNPDVDTVYAYQKAKHRGAERSILSVYADRLRMMMALRRENFDYAILATPLQLPHPGRRPAGLPRRHGQ